MPTIFDKFSSFYLLIDLFYFFVSHASFREDAIFLRVIRFHLIAYTML